MCQFIIYGLPRSRTAWLAAFLSHGDWRCHHDAILEAESLWDLEDILSKPHTGTVETGLTRGFLVMRDLFPNARVVVVRRPVSDVAESAANLGWEYPDGYLEEEAERLDLISHIPGVLTVTFESLASEAVCKAVYEHCLQQPFDRSWWAALARKNIQINTSQQVMVCAARIPFTDRIFSDIAEYVFCQNESLSYFLKDGIAMFKEHRDEVGPLHNLPYDPDINQLVAMERLGILQCTTARTGAGELVGYVFFTITPCPESKTYLLGTQGGFFVKKEYRGSVGLRLHEFARKKLVERGVYAAVLKAGFRGTGPKLRSLIDSLGATSLGELFFLPLGG